MLFNKAKSALDVSFSHPPPTSKKSLDRTMENQLIITKDVGITGTLNSYNSL